MKLKLNKKLQTDLWLLIFEYNNPIKDFFLSKVLPFIFLKNKIKLFFKNTEFVYFKLPYDNSSHHFLINIINTIHINIALTINEYELKNIKNIKNYPNLKNIWIMINATETFNYFGGNLHKEQEFLYINKYNYCFFAIKIKKQEKANIHILEPLKCIHLYNYTNYYSSRYFMHLPDVAIQKLTNFNN